MIRQSCPVSQRHGRQHYASALEMSGSLLAQLARDPALAPLDITQVAFLDCETTGLAGGTGTCAFLVGIAWIESASIQIEQHFLPDYPTEPAFVAAVDACLEDFGGIVSFNGKSFDLPLLETRFALNRHPAGCLEIPHADLLHPARRLWRHRLESCSLGSLEQRVLHHYRDDDVPGWLIPGLYFDYLRTGDVRPLSPVFEHNRLDLLAMVALVGRFGQILTGEAGPDDPRDLYGLGTIFEDLGLVDRALDSYETALGIGLPYDLQGSALIRIAVTHRRAERGELALAAWQRLADFQGDAAARALVEMAKHYEHGQRDYALATDLTRQASLLVGQKPWLAGGDTAPDALGQRLARLERKAARLNKPSGQRGRRVREAKPDTELVRGLAREPTSLPPQSGPDRASSPQF